MLIFFLFLVSGHYGPDAFFNSGCKCVLVFSDYLINHQKLSCLLSLTYWLEGKKKWLNDWFLFFFISSIIKMQINILALYNYILCISGSAPLWPPIPTTAKTYIDPHTVRFLILNKIYFLNRFSFSMKIQQKQ